MKKRELVHGVHVRPCSNSIFAQVGQLVGNFMGLPFEFQYNNEPMPFEPKTYYDLGSARASGLRINTDGRGRIPQRLSQLQGGQKTSENMPVWPSGLIIWTLDLIAYHSDQLAHYIQIISIERVWMLQDCTWVETPPKKVCFDLCILHPFAFSALLCFWLLTQAFMHFSWIPQLRGAYTDDDTDIEFVTLHALERHGLDLSYKQIAGYWKRFVHIRVNGGDALWFANKVARENMNRGQLPPQTGSQSNNRYWIAVNTTLQLLSLCTTYVSVLIILKMALVLDEAEWSLDTSWYWGYWWTIDPQLVNEIWSAVYPGMIDKAVERAEWGARITSDSWGTHPTRFYAALYSGAFFSSNVDQLYGIAMSKVPGDSPFHQGLKDVRRWKNESPHDWKPTWYKIRNKYARYPADCGGLGKLLSLKWPTQERELQGQ